MNDVERLTDRRDGDACWPWLGAINNKGYGVVNIIVDGRRTTTSAHRAAYELHIAPIPPGLEIDHLCRSRDCVNPTHMEVVTHAENMRRAVAATGGNNGNGRKTHCPQGHEYTPENIYRHGGRRGCRICRREHVAAFQERARAERQREVSA